MEPMSFLLSAHLRRVRVLSASVLLALVFCLATPGISSSEIARSARQTRSAAAPAQADASTDAADTATATKAVKRGAVEAATSATTREAQDAASKAPAPTVPLQPAPAGFDIQGNTRAVLEHLNAVIRYYRAALPPIQTVGEPSDLLYREQALSDAGQVAQYAFQAGKAEAVLLQQYAQRAGVKGAAPAEGEAQRLQAVRGQVADRIATIKDQQKTVEGQLEHARGAQIATLQQQREQLDGALDLNLAMNDALGKIVTMSDSQGRTGLAGDIERLQRSAPELQNGKNKPPITLPLESLGGVRSAGVSSQAEVLFHLFGTRQAIDTWIGDTDSLHTQAIALRAPLTTIARSLVQQGQVLSQQAIANPADANPLSLGTAKGTSKPAAAAKKTSGPTLQQQLQAERASFDSVTATFKVLSAASIPLSQEVITLEQTRANLVTWRAAVDLEYRSVLRNLLLRVLGIAIALGVLFALGEVWRRATVRYVHDLRRRRQLLVLRRVILGFLSGLVLIFGFVTQFNSLATFAGFITAGIAVGLQTILLSVAAYFFIVGRYGVRVGDRITIASVTGDVVDVGLVRFYMMELAGSGTELHPTGRVAVFSNAVLFQAGTPLYKQMPGTEYAWHELTAKLSPTGDYDKATTAMLKAVRSVYESYRVNIEDQHRAVETWMDTPIAAPEIASHLQLMDDGLEFWVRFPVEIRKAAAIDEQITEALLKLMSSDAEIKSAITATPLIKAAIKG